MKNRLGGTLGVPLGGSWVLETPKIDFLSIFDRFLSQLDPLLGVKLALTSSPWRVLGRLDPSCRGLWPLFFPFFFRIKLFIDF